MARVIVSPTVSGIMFDAVGATVGVTIPAGSAPVGARMGRAGVGAGAGGVLVGTGGDVPASGGILRTIPTRKRVESVRLFALMIEGYLLPLP